MQFIKKYFGLIFVLAISFFAIQPLFTPGFFPMHDDTQVARVFEMGKALKDGMFPVRWVSDLGYGYGYPIFNFYAPLSYYVGGGFVVLGVEPLMATKIMIAIGMLLAGVGMYLLSKSIWGEFAGIVSGILYMYAPYHALNLYVRGAIGELWAYGLLPFMAWGFYEISKFKVQNSKLPSEVWKWVAVASLGYAGVILSHNLTAMMVTPFLIIALLLYCFIAYKKNQLYAIRYFLYAIILGLMISAFYWLPAIFEMSYTNVRSQVGGGADFRDHFVCIQQLWSSRWQFGGSTKDCMDGLSFQIGKIHILFVSIAVAIGCFAFFVKKQKKFALGVFLLFLGFTVSTVFTLEWSRFVWEKFPQMAFIQYPWRFLILIDFFAALLAGSIVFFVQHIHKINLNKKLIIVAVLIVSLGIAIFYKRLFVSQTIFPITSRDLVNVETLRFKTSKISDEYMPGGFKKPKYENESVKTSVVSNSENVKINILKQKTQYIRGTVQATEKTPILFQIAHFPSWEFMVNNQEEIPLQVKNGYILIFPSGISTFEAVFAETSLEKIANFISLGGLLVLLIGIIYTRRKGKNV